MRTGRETPVSEWVSIRFPFNQAKAAEAAAVLLGRAGGKMPYMRLIKLMYLADRESLHRFGRPIVGGRYVAMKYGPVLSEVLPPDLDFAERIARGRLRAGGL